MGTKFDHRKQKQGNEDLENWLNRLIEPKIGLAVYTVQYAATKRIVLFEIPAAFNQPTAFAGREYVRIGSCRQDLRRYPETENSCGTRLIAYPMSNPYQQSRIYTLRR